MSEAATPQEIKDYGIDTSITEHEGFSPGDEIRVEYDGEHPSDQLAYFAGDEGTVLGFARVGPGLFNPSERIDMIVKFRGQEPFSVVPEDCSKI